MMKMSCCSCQPSLSCLCLPVRKPAVRSVRVLPRCQDGDLQERLRGVVSAGLCHQRGVSLSRPHQSRLQPSEKRQGPVPGHLQGEVPGQPASLRVRPAGLQPGPVQPEPHEHAQNQTLLHLSHTVGHQGQDWGPRTSRGLKVLGGFKKMRENLFLLRDIFV